MWFPSTERPAPGSRIVAIHSDGSGGAAFFVYEGGMFDAGGAGPRPEPHDLDFAEEYSLWAHLPPGFLLFGEGGERDAYSQSDFMADPSPA